MKGNHLQMVVACALIGGAVGLRLLPHPANFAPMMAIAVFGGAVLPRRLAVAVPLAAMMMSDLIIGFYDIMPVVWGCYVLVAFSSSYWLRRPGFARGVVVTLSASLFFFMVTNFAVWVSSSMYAHSWTGLLQCYEMAVPFFRATLMSDLTYTAVLFAAYGLAIARLRRAKLAWEAV